MPMNGSFTLLSDYQHWLNQQRISSSSKKVYISNVRKMLLFCLSKKTEELPDKNNWHKISADFLSFQSPSRKASLAPSLNSLAKFLGVSQLRGLRSTCVHTTDLSMLSESECTRFLELVAEHAPLRDIVLVKLMLNYGIRTSELVALSFEDFIKEKTNAYVFISGRNSRVIPLDSSISNDLDKLICSQAVAVNDKYIFRTKLGKRIDSQTINSVLRSLGFKA